MSDDRAGSRLEARATRAFRYRAFDGSGATVSGAIEAADRADAFAKLTEKDLSPFALDGVAPRRGLRDMRRTLRSKDLARYLRQLATLLSANVTAFEAFTTLGRGRAEPLIAKRNQKILSELRSGKRLSAAMAQHLPELPPYVFRLAELGEATGSLGKALSDAADRMDYGEQVRSDIRTALTYPAFLLVIGSVIVAMMFMFVVPRFATLMGDDLSRAPLISRIVIETGLGFQKSWPLVLAALAGLVLAIGTALRRPDLRAVIDRTLHTAPLIGPFLKVSDLAGWCRTVGIAVANKAQLVDALRLAETGVRSFVFRGQLERARTLVRGGRALEEALLEADPDFDPMVLDLIRTGRNSGALGDMLLFSAGLFEKEARERTRQLTTLAEPAAVIGVALVVAVVVISIVLAMTSLYDLQF
ncbi:MAG: type II secretion system F family protein [Parvularculaceae bacterium]|nr:type II secretion system F family protein [Parvularculaceae bacterium]